jgi:glycosyltransferase involved in cell wall biosynthesis
VANQPLRILFDGWSLVHQPNHPAALHLLDLLSHFPQELEAFLALPGKVNHSIGVGHAVTVVEETGRTVGERLQWEQRSLVAIGNRVGADLIHLVTTTPSLTGRLPVVVSPAGYGATSGSRQGGWKARLREALAVGGMSRVKAIFWPVDLPEPRLGAPVYRLPGLVAPDYNPHDPVAPTLLEQAGLPESYLLYHGPPDPTTWARLLDSWSWAAGSIGEYYPLVVLGFTPEAAREDFLGQARRAGLDSTLRVLPEIPPEQIPGIYRASSGLYHLGEVPAWGDPVRAALACGKPVVVEISRHAEALVGPAGFLLEAGETRQMGAALITVIVNDDVSADLRLAAQKQAVSWESENFPDRLRAAYLKVLQES